MMEPLQTTTSLMFCFGFFYYYSHGVFTIFILFRLFDLWMVVCCWIAFCWLCQPQCSVLPAVSCCDLPSRTIATLVRKTLKEIIATTRMNERKTFMQVGGAASGGSCLSLHHLTVRACSTAHGEKCKRNNHQLADINHNV